MASVITKASTLSDASVAIMNQAVILSGEAYNKMDAYATHNEQAMASTISFNVFSRMTATTTALTDGSEADSVAMSETKAQLTMAEYGAVLTSTSLANISTGGKADLASAELIGVHLGESTDKIAVGALLTSTTGVTSTAGTTPNTLLKSDLRGCYTRLVTDGIAKFTDGRFVAFMNPAQVADIKDEFIGIVANTDANTATSGQVGQLEGFTIVENPNVTAGKVICMGRSGLAKGTALSPAIRITEGNDNLGRTVNVGWYGVFAYKILDPKAVEILTGV